MSFFFLSQSFFIDKEENHLLESIVSVSFIVEYIAVYFACSTKKRDVYSNMNVFAKSVSLFTKM